MFAEDTLAHGLRVLVVEDEALIAMLLEDILSDLGCDVVAVAANAADALRAACRPVDIALMDVDIAGPMDGIETALRLRRDHGIASLFVTSHRAEDLRTRTAPARPLGFVSKPYATADIARALRSAVPRLAA